MNTRMARIFTALGLGFVGIIGMLTWWQVIVAGDLRQRDENNQTAYYEQRVQRGFISTRDGVRIAGRGASKGINGDTIWRRRYPQGTLGAHVLGYDTRGHSRAGVERAMNDVLTGSTRNLGAVVGLLDGDEEAIGDDVRLTLDSRGQRAAERALAEGGYTGAVVAIEPKTGRVLTMASGPTFTPASIVENYARAATGSKLFNRATQGAYPPGSTFKVVTASAALENGVPVDRQFKGGCTFPTPGPDVGNFGGSCPGAHDFTEALTKSINVTFAELGAELGDAKLREQMQKFGFFSTPPLYGLPGNELRASGLTGTDGKPLPEETGFDEARTAIGQDKLTVSPLQMALVAAGIGNDGVVPEPTLIERVTRPEGGLVEERRERTWKRAISAQTAGELVDMMKNVVTEGSGTQARIQGIDVAGKTGTADSPSGNITWFIAFAPAESPKVAIAVAIENQSSGQTGGAIAAPIARRVMEAILRRDSAGAA
ncbi:MAG: Peptidoglycan glycosyltransferase [Thermoleophilia bacterium]|nr:Peptidoglycan glycosyltransferase [Thermoleophilia bacterium]